MQTRTVTDVTAPTDVPLSLEDRAAIRAYLQRSEVRLSTVHRVASALLSGAGLLVLLPAVERDAVEVVLRTLLTGPADAVHLLLVVAVATSLAVPFTALWLVLRDLTQYIAESQRQQRPSQGPAAQHSAKEHHQHRAAQ